MKDWRKKNNKCKYCKNVFDKKTERHVFCSGRCKEAYRLSKKTRHKGKCAVCGKEFEYIINGHAPIKRHCSMACAARGSIPTKTCVCKDCGISFEFVGRTTKLRCNTCWSKHRSNQTMLYRRRKDPSVQIGVGSGGGQNSSDELTDTPERDALRARRREDYRKNAEYYRASASYKYQRVMTGADECRMCGYSKHQDALVVHHIDMDRTHNEDSNLVILCSNCHAILHKHIRRKQKIHHVKSEDIFAKLLKAESKERN